MKLGSELEVPFEQGDLVKTHILWAGMVIGEIEDVCGVWLSVNWGPRDERHLHITRWWNLELVRPAIRGYPYERKIPGVAWVLLWGWYFPYRLWRRLSAWSVRKGGKLW